MKLLLVRIRWPCPIWLTTPRINKTWGRRLLSPLERGGNYFAASFYSPLFLANSNVISTYHHNSDGGESWRLFSLRPLARVGLLAEFLHSVFLFILFYDGPKEMDWSPTFLAYLVGIHLIRPWSLITLLFWPVMCNSTSQPTNSFPFLVNRYLTSPHGAFTLASDCIYWWKNFPFGCAFTSSVSLTSFRLIAFKSFDSCATNLVSSSPLPANIRHGMFTLLRWHAPSPSNLYEMILPIKCLVIDRPTILFNRTN